MGRAMILPALLLAACGSGETGSNRSSDAEPTGSVARPQAVPENLMDDPLNQVVPLDPPPAAAPPQPARAPA